MNNIDKIIKSIFAINPTAQFTFEEEDIDNIQWLNGTTPIPKADIEAKMVEVQADYDAEEWTSRNRQIEYPSIDDCIHGIIRWW